MSRFPKNLAPGSQGFQRVAFLVVTRLDCLPVSKFPKDQEKVYDSKGLLEAV